MCRKLYAALAVAAALVLAAPRAGAVVLQSVGNFNIPLYNQKFSFLGFGLGGTPDAPATINGSAPGAHVNTLTIVAGQISRRDTVAVGVTGTSTVPPPGPQFIGAIQENYANDKGVFTGSPLHGQMALRGLAKMCMFNCSTAPIQNLIVPMTVIGSGGAAFVDAVVNSTVRGAPWTTGTAAVGTLTMAGFRHGPGSLASSTAQGNGVIQLVTPILISTNSGGPLPYADTVISGFAVLDLRFIPEPGTALLLGSGIAGLVLFGRTKRG